VKSQHKAIIHEIESWRHNFMKSHHKSHNFVKSHYKAIIS